MDSTGLVVKTKSRKMFMLSDTLICVSGDGKNNVKWSVPIVEVSESGVIPCSSRMLVRGMSPIFVVRHQSRLNSYLSCPHACLATLLCYDCFRSPKTVFTSTSPCTRSSEGELKLLKFSTKLSYYYNKRSFITEGLRHRDPHRPVEFDDLSPDTHGNPESREQFRVGAELLGPEEFCGVFGEFSADPGPGFKGAKCVAFA